MKAKSIFLVFAILSLAITTCYAVIYVNEDFENYANGDDIIKKEDLWVLTEPQDNPVGGGIASSKQAHSGKISAIFDQAQCMGFPYAELQLPDTYVISTWFYHDSKQMPPPDAFVIIIPDTFPGGGNTWMGLGTRIQAIVLEITHIAIKQEPVYTKIPKCQEEQTGFSLPFLLNLIPLISMLMGKKYIPPRSLRQGFSGTKCPELHPGARRPAKSLLMMSYSRTRWRKSLKLLM